MPQPVEFETSIGLQTWANVCGFRMIGNYAYDANTNGLRGFLKDDDVPAVKLERDMALIKLLQSVPS